MSEAGLPENWRIRDATREDVPELAALYRDVRRSTFTWIPPDRFKIEDFAHHSQGERVILCQTECRQIAGLMSLWPTQDFIHMLYVGLEFQGKGVGRALLHALPGWPDKEYRLKCLINNVRAQAFYIANGFEALGTGWSIEGEYRDFRLKVGT